MNSVVLGALPRSVVAILEREARVHTFSHSYTDTSVYDNMRTDGTDTSGYWQKRLERTTFGSNVQLYIEPTQIPDPFAYRGCNPTPREMRQRGLQAMNQTRSSARARSGWRKKNDDAMQSMRRNRPRDRRQ